MATTKTMMRKTRSRSEKAKSRATSGTAIAPNPFWDFSLKVYGKDGTAPACLALQDSKGLDVNLLLFCCWAGAQGHLLAAEEIERLMAAVKPWRSEVVEPLRKLRRQLKSGQDGGSDALLAQAKAAELEAEAVVQRVLLETLPLERREGSAKVAAQNLKVYAAQLEIQCDSAVTADLAAVLRGAFPKLAPLEAVWTLL